MTKQERDDLLHEEYLQLAAKLDKCKLSLTVVIREALFIAQKMLDIIDYFNKGE